MIDTVVDSKIKIKLQFAFSSIFYCWKTLQGNKENYKPQKNDKHQFVLLKKKLRPIIKRMNKMAGTNYLQEELDRQSAIKLDVDILFDTFIHIWKKFLSKQMRQEVLSNNRNWTKLLNEKQKIINILSLFY